MKKLIFLCLAAIATSGIFASPFSDASERILKVFHHDFPYVQKQIFHDYGDCYMVYFSENDHSSCRVYYNLDGSMEKTVKYYSVAELDPFIRAKVNEKYSGKSIFGVTEVQSDDDHFYEIVLQDNKAWYTIKSDPTGRMSLEKKLKKA